MWQRKSYAVTLQSSMRDIRSWRHYERTPLVDGLLTHAHEIWLGTRIQANEHDADRAIGCLVNANVRLVYSIARKYAVRNRDYDDLCSEGLIGLHTSAKRYDPGTGYRFTTYATYWIMQRINRSVLGHAMVRLPQGKYSDLMHIMESRRMYYRLYGHWPTSVQLLAQMHKDASKYPESLRAKLPRLTSELVEEYLGYAASEHVSLEDTVRGTDSITEGDLVSSGEDITDGMDDAAVTQAIEDTIGILPVRDQLLMRMRYGIGQPDNKEHTLNEISEATGISRERVRQVIQLSLRLMAQSEKARILRQTLER